MRETLLWAAWFVLMMLLVFGIIKHGASGYIAPSPVGHQSGGKK